MSKDNGQEKGLIEAVSHQLCPEIAPREFFKTLKEICCKNVRNGVSNEEMMAFLMVCREHHLNPIMKEIHPMRTKAGFTVTVGIDGWMKIANRHPEFNGMDIEDNVNHETGKPINCTVKIHRKDREHPVSVTEWYAECYRDTEPWNTRPIRMLRHKACIQCIRYAFNLGGIMDPEEAREIGIVDQNDVPKVDRMTIGPMKLEVEAHKAGVSVQELEEVSQDLFSKSYQNLTPDEATAVLEDAIGYSQNDLDPDIDQGDTGDITHASPDKAKSSPVSAGDQEDFLP